MTFADGACSGSRRAVAAGAALMLAAAAAAVGAAVASARGQAACAAPAHGRRRRPGPLPAAAGAAGSGSADRPVRAGLQHPAHGRRNLRGAGTAGPADPSQSACVAAAERAGRDWLRAGLVPGATAAQRSMATRALLDLRLAVQPDGAVLAGWRSGWEYAWPRDSSWVAVALAETGHPAMAYQILRFLQRMQAAQRDLGRQVPARRLGPGARRPARRARRGRLGAVGRLVLGAAPGS